jgi:hypothetical protein
VCYDRGVVLTCINANTSHGASWKAIAKNKLHALNQTVCCLQQI